MGIRVALGATRFDVVRMICRQAAVTVGMGVSLGLLAGAAQALRAVLFDVSASDPSVFVTIGAVLPSVALVACLVPAIRATRLDPVSALSSE